MNWIDSAVYGFEIEIPNRLWGYPIAVSPDRTWTEQVGPCRIFSFGFALCSRLFPFFGLHNTLPFRALIYLTAYTVHHQGSQAGQELKQKSWRIAAY